MSLTITVNQDKIPASTEGYSRFASGVDISNSTSGFLDLLKNSGTGIVSRPKTRKAGSSRVVRRMNGFYLQEEGEEVRVAIVENKRLVHYFLPAKLLKQGGVDSENQPFEMDELETKVDGVVMKGYKITATAKKENSYPEALDLDEKTKMDLDYILANFKDA